MPTLPDRTQIVNRARGQWISRLIDLSRRNRLLYFRDLKTGSLDLTAVSGALLPSLLRSEPVRLSSLFEEDEHRSLVARMLEIRRKAIENLEERGLATMHLGLGMATWASSDGGRPPAAPVLLLPVLIELRGRDGTGSVIRSAGDIRVNPVLLHVLEAEHGVAVPPEEVLQAIDDEANQRADDLAESLSIFARHSAGVPGFTIESRVVLGNFSFQKMAMVQDIKEYAEEIAAHDLIAALAGDEGARSAISESRGALDPRTLDSKPVANDLLILDADSSQQTVVAAALSGQDGVIQGPPGTGKSQTIANTIASLVGAGKRVLFVAEKRAALEVVARRLQGCGLGHVFLDLHGADIRRSEVAKRLAECLSGIRESTVVDTAESDLQLEAKRQALNEHVRRMHTPRPPSGKTIYAIQGELLRLPKEAHVSTRWRGKELGELTADRVGKGSGLLRDATATPELFLRTHPSSWTSARITNQGEIEAAIELTDQSALEDWPSFSRGIEAVVGEAGFESPRSLSEVQELLDRVGDVQEILKDHDQGLFELDLCRLEKDLSPASGGPLRKTVAWCFNPAFRSALKCMAGVQLDVKTTWEDRLRTAQRANKALAGWREKRIDGGKPRVVPSFAATARAATQLQTDLKALQAIIVVPDVGALDLDGIEQLLEALHGDRTTPYLLPKLRRIERDLASLGLEGLVLEFRKKRLLPQLWEDALAFAWLSSLINAERAADPDLAGFSGTLHDQIVEAFRELDQRRLDNATLLVRRLHAERAVSAMNQHRTQDGIVRREARKKNRHLPVRQLLAEASDVLLALCPCWMASPLSVSHLLDGKQRYFDVVIFDEASQVPPEDAIPAVLRGKRTVVAGDRHQLPPTTFFDTDVEDDSGLQASDATVGFESVLDIMSAFLEPWSLDWHYRSRDERLIAFSNRHIYGNRLVTFPGVGGSSAIAHVQASGVNEPDPESASGEVRRVVELVLEHARSRPQESLGVIAMGLKHALRVEREIWRVRQGSPDLDEFFDETSEERFFVKNLERVQGDERDAIILTVGYSKDSSGRLLNRFGPLNFVGGERRLNVAVTRARERLTLVSSFVGVDMDPNRFSAHGVRLLKDYLEYAASGGEVLRTSSATGNPLNAFEADVFQTLKAEGLGLIPQWGASRYCIDMVVQHPKEPGRFVLAIECDGASYHSAYTARDRDRLRQQQLEALGWQFHRIWSTDWFLRKDEEVKRALMAYDRALTLGYAVPDDEPIRTGRAETQRPSRGERPRILARGSITEYRQGELMALIRWIASDGVPLTDDEIVREVLKELGFKRKGIRIEAAIRAALDVVRARQSSMV